MDIDKLRIILQNKITGLDDEFYKFYRITEEPEHLYEKEQILKEQELLQWVIELTYQK